MEIYNRELRNIRITLIFLTLIILIVGGADEHVDVQYEEDISTESNMVDLGNGYFGVLQGFDPGSSEQIIKVFSYDEKTNSIEHHLNKDLMEFEYE